MKKFFKYYGFFILSLLASLLCGITVVSYILIDYFVITIALWSMSAGIWLTLAFTSGLSLAKMQKEFDEQFMKEEGAR